NLRSMHALDDTSDVGQLVVDSLDRRNQVFQLLAHGLTVARPGCPQLLPQIEAPQICLAQLIQFKDHHDVGREVEFVLRVTQLQVGVEDSDSEIFQAFRIVCEVTD